MLKFNCEIQDGKLEIDRQLFQKYVSKQKNGKYLLEIKHWYKKRTILQNKWYWEVLTILASDLGYETKEELHNNLKYTFMGGMDDRGIFYTKSTTKLTTIEMMEYFDRIYQWAAEQGIILPDPKPNQE